MKYVIRLYECDNDNEKFLKSYSFDTVPYVPSKGQVILCNDEVYEVLNVSVSYDNYLLRKTFFEVAVKQQVSGKEWWERYD